MRKSRPENKRKKFLPSLEKKDILFMFILLLISILIRVLIVHSNPIIREDEECWVGTIANEIIENKNHNLFEYPRIFGGGYFYNGRIIEGFITAVMFKIFGVTGYSIKYTHILLGSLLWIVSFLYLFRFYRRRTAYIGGLFFTFSFPVITLMSISQGGPHLLGTLLSMILLYLLFYILEADLDIKHPLSIIYLSLFVIGIFLNYYLIIFMFANLAYLLYQNKKQHSLVVGIILFSLVFILLVSGNLLVGGIGSSKIEFLEYVLSKNLFFHKYIPNVFKSIISFFYTFDDILFSFSKYPYPLIFIGKIVSWSLLVIPLFSLRKKNKREPIFLFYSLCFVLIYFMFYKIEEYRSLYNFRHFFILIFFITLNLSIFLTSTKFKLHQKVIPIILSLLLIGNLYTSLNLVKEQETIYSPLCYDVLGQGYILEYSDSTVKECFLLHDEHVFDCLNGFREVHMFHGSVGFCQQYEKEIRPFCFISYSNYNSLNENITEEIINNISEEEQIQSQLKSMNISNQKKFRYITDPTNAIYGRFYYTNKLSECSQDENEKLCMLRVSYDLSHSLAYDYLKTEDILCEKSNFNLKEFCYFGLGKRIGEINFLNTTNALRDCNLVNENYRNICIEGVCNTYNIYKPYENISFC